MPPYLFIGDWTRILSSHRFRKYADSLSTRYRIRCGFLSFHSGERIQKYPDSLLNSLDTGGSHIRKEKVANGDRDVWTGPKILCTAVPVYKACYYLRKILDDDAFLHFKSKLNLADIIMPNS